MDWFPVRSILYKIMIAFLSGLRAIALFPVFQILGERRIATTGVSGGSSFWYMESSGGEDLICNGKSGKFVACVIGMFAVLRRCGMDTSSEEKARTKFPTWIVFAARC
ncbi:MAG: hypothetical protein ACLVGL_17450 [Waltera sp.]